MTKRGANWRHLMLLYVAALALVLSSLTPIRGEPEDLDRVAQLYRDGQFIEAAKLAEQAGDADGFAFAARALIADVMSSEPGHASSNVLKQAEKDARAALDLDGNHLEGHLQLAVTLGLKGRRVGRLRAHFQGLARDGKIHLDQALEQAPDNAWVLSVLGGWHLEIVRRAGPKTADWLYKANKDTGMDYFERALSTAPHTLPIRHHYALLLLSFDEPALHERAKAVLTEAVEATAGDYFDRISQQRCGELLSALESNRSRTIARVVKRQMKIF